ncbi:MAG: 3-deoxy-manno-octulosonate cytidylyltransferase [Phycisphaerales bacterium]
MSSSMDIQAVAIIPARLGSTRFPRKALANDTGKPMVVHVCEQAAKANSVGKVVVATDAIEIKAAVESSGYEAVMTDPAHTNGTSRLAEAATILGLQDDQVVVNVQGDEPEIEPAVIDGAIEAVWNQVTHPWYSEVGPVNPAVGTVVSPMGHSSSQSADPNIVKAVLGRVESGSQIAQALYFSRAQIPHDRDGSHECVYYRHVGIYAYTVHALAQYVDLESSPLEQAESLEQLRWLEYGFPISAAIRDSSHSGIDTQEQYRSFVDRYHASNRAAD